MLGASYEECIHCHAKVDTYDKKCSNCGSTDFKKSKSAVPKVVPDKPEVTTPPVAPPSKPDHSIGDLITAQNRTTHAVRAFVTFLFIQLAGSTFAIILWNVGDLFIDQEECRNYGRNCEGNGFLRFLAAVVWIIAIIWSSNEGWKELKKSEVN
jgi:hypothetical protein